MNESVAIAVLAVTVLGYFVARFALIRKMREEQDRANKIDEWFV